MKTFIFVVFLPFITSSNVSVIEDTTDGLGEIIPNPTTPDIFLTDLAIKALEDIIIEEIKVRDFCSKHYETESEIIIAKPKPANCAELYNLGIRESGVYTIHLKSSPVEVFCDMESEGGGWTVIQRRGVFRGSPLNFTRNWLDYASGFGNISKEFWLGNKIIHELSSQDDVSLRIELRDFEGNFRYANYDMFHVGDHRNAYLLKAGLYSGDAGDSLSYHSDMPFFTYDNDNAGGCASTYKGGWWFHNCLYANLNGEYMDGTNNKYTGIIWYYWLGKYYSLSWTEMKIRPQGFFAFNKEA